MLRLKQDMQSRNCSSLFRQPDLFCVELQICSWQMINLQVFSPLFHILYVRMIINLFKWVYVWEDGLKIGYQHIIILGLRKLLVLFISFIDIKLKNIMSWKQATGDKRNPNDFYSWLNFLHVTVKGPLVTWHKSFIRTKKIC